MNKLIFLMKIAIISCISIILICFNVFASNADIKIRGENKYKSFRIPKVILNSFQDGIPSIALNDIEGNKIPHFENGGDFEIAEYETNYNLKEINNYLKNDDYFIDYEVICDDNIDPNINYLNFNTNNKSFVKNIEINGSYDNQQWELISKDIIYNVDGNFDLTVEFEGMKKYRYYRIKFDNNKDIVEFNENYVTYNELSYTKSNFVESFKAEFGMLLTEDNVTKINISGVQNLFIDKIEIETNSKFKREISLFDKYFSIYNLELGENIYNNTTIPLNGFFSDADVLTLKIENYDDAPIVIDKITVYYHTCDIVFEAGTNKSLTLEILPLEEKPVYDIVNYKENILLSENIDVVSLENIVIDQQLEIVEFKERDYDLILNILLYIVAGIVAMIVFMKLKAAQ